MKISPVNACFILLLVSLPTALIGQEIIYFDDFSTKKDYNNSCGERRDGYYLLSNPSTEYIGILSLDKNIDTKRNFEIESKLAITSGIANQIVGIIWGKTTNSWDNFYSFSFSGNSNFAIGKMENGKWNYSIVPWQNTPHIKVHEYNKLMIRKIGNSCYFYINDELVHQGIFESFYGQSNCLYTSANSNSYVMYISIKYITNYTVSSGNTVNSGNTGNSGNNNQISNVSNNTQNITTSTSYAIVNTSPFNYTEIPLGVQLVNSEEEWNKLSPTKACCCYPNFDSGNKAQGLLYNYHAFMKIANTLKAQGDGTLVLSKDDWDQLLERIKVDRSNVANNSLNFYPGYFDEAWYTSGERFSGYWLDEEKMVSFSHDNYGEPMIDENVSGERQGFLALSIRVNKTEQNLCKEDKWIVEPILARGYDNSIKLITNAKDWKKYSSKKPCCCFLNFDYNNEDYGLLYNGFALVELIYDKSIYKKGYRIATQLEFEEIMKCRTSNNSYSEIFNCENQNDDGFFISPNGCYGVDGWHLPEEGKSYFRVLGEGRWNLGYKFDCATKSHEKINAKIDDAMFVKFIKIE